MEAPLCWLSGRPALHSDLFSFSLFPNPEGRGKESVSHSSSNNEGGIGRPRCSRSRGEEVLGLFFCGGKSGGGGQEEARRRPGFRGAPGLPPGPPGARLQARVPEEGWGPALCRPLGEGEAGAALCSASMAVLCPGWSAGRRGCGPVPS